MSLNSLESWYSYFKRNSSEPGDIPWHIKNDLSALERSLIAKSIATFQLGEYSEGRHLLAFAEEYARINRNPHIVPVTKYFIAEEQNHASLLKKFMSIHDIKLIQKNWTDSVFRRLRKYLGFEVSVTVLITAEILALVFYDALKEATNSLLLKRICEKILTDERSHVRYESELIEYIRSQKSVFARASARIAHQVLFSGTVLVVNFEHRRVIKAGGYPLRKFWFDSWGELNKHFSQVTMTVSIADV
jgi:rubrerythrin